MLGACFLSVRRFLRKVRKQGVLLTVRLWRKVALSKQRNRLIPSVAIRFLDQSVSQVARCEWVATIVQILESLDHVPHLWVRGPNARQTRLFHQVSAKESPSEEVLLLSHKAPVWMCRSPENAMTAAHHAGGTVLVLVDPREDALDASQFVVVVAEKDFQPLSASRKILHLVGNSDALVCLDMDSYTVSAIKKQYPATYAASWSLNHTFGEGEHFIGFTGMKDAGAFYRTLLQHSVRVEGFIPVNYHKNFKEKILNALASTASKQNVRLMTTDKDSFFLSAKMRHNVTVVPLVMVVERGFVNALVEKGLARTQENVTSVSALAFGEGM